jgi:cyclic di-GMP phosphodiesterase
MSRIKKIPLTQLKPGMFIHEMDISWIKSPFLRHRRKLENQQDILLLKQAGVKFVSIDLEKGFDVVNESDEQSIEHDGSSSVETNKSPKPPRITEKTHIQNKSNSLNEELKTARIIQNKIQSLVSKLNDNIKNGLPVSIKDVSPIINESLESIKRNDQALLTMLHMHRKDIRLDSHAFGVFSLVLPIAIKSKCSTQQIEILGMAALLHDCGWSRLPINLFGKGKPYTVSEKKLIQQHIPLIVQVLRKSQGIPDEVIQLIEQHHELASGKGYPNKLIKKQLHPLYAYLQVADLYDELLHGLEDNPRMLAVNALKNLYKKSTAGWFPETLVSEMIRILGVYPISSVVKLSSNQTAVVTEINHKLPLLPRVTLLLDEKQKISDPGLLIDLSSDDQQRTITKVIEPSTLPKHLSPNK